MKEFCLLSFSPFADYFPNQRTCFSLIFGDILCWVRPCLFAFGSVRFMTGRRMFVVTLFFEVGTGALKRHSELLDKFLHVTTPTNPFFTGFSH